MEIEKNVVLAPLTTFKIGGKADYFCRVTDTADLRLALTFAGEKKLPIFVLGGGSNLIINDDGFRGLVIKTEIFGLEVSGNSIISGAGENWDNVVRFSLERKLFGLENLSAVPGTVGGAAVQNIGAYGIELKKFVSWVEAVNIEDSSVKKFSGEECAYGYRQSFFKSPLGRKWVISRVCFTLDQEPKVNITYKDLAKYFSGKSVALPTPQEVRDAVIKIRAQKFPPLNKFGTAGSFFKNPVVGGEEAKALADKFPGLPIFDAGAGKKKISLAWLIDNVCSLKGSRIGNVKVSEAQALVLVSEGEATSSEVLELANLIQQTVQEATGLKIEPEVESV